MATAEEQYLFVVDFYFRPEKVVWKKAQISMDGTKEENPAFILSFLILLECYPILLWWCCLCRCRLMEFRKLPSFGSNDITRVLYNPPSSSILYCQNLIVIVAISFVCSSTRPSFFFTRPDYYCSILLFWIQEKHFLFELYIGEKTPTSFQLLRRREK